MNLTWFGWFLIGWWGIKPVLNIATIGDPQKPVTRGGAVFAVVLTAAFIVALVTVGANH